MPTVMTLQGTDPDPWNIIPWYPDSNDVVARRYATPAASTTSTTSDIPTPAPHATQSTPVWPWLVAGGAVAIIGAVVTVAIYKQKPSKKPVRSKPRRRYA